jgi:hypothetical protein
MRVYNREVLPEVNRAIKAFKCEVSPDWQRERKVDYLLGRVADLRLSIARYEAMRKRCIRENFQNGLQLQLIDRRLADFRREMRKTDNALRFWMFGKKPVQKHLKEEK